MATSRSRWLGWSVGIVVLGLVALWPLNNRATAFIQGDGFRTMLDREISKGMKFEGHFDPLRRVGALGLATDGFQGEHGTHTIVSMEAHGVTGWFNPLGIGLRHWELHDLRIARGIIWLQKTDPTPGAPKGAPSIPWTALFWPYRVELEDVTCPDADVLFKLSDKESGIYHTQLEITPNGRDFEYDARGGDFKIPSLPGLKVQHIHLLIRKPQMTCEELQLVEDPAQPDQQLSVTGKAGLQDERFIDAQVKLKSLPIEPFLPDSLHGHVSGNANGQIDYHSTGTGLETASAHGAVDVTDAVARDLKMVQEYVKITASPDPGPLHFTVFRSKVKVEQGTATLEDIEAVCPGVIKVTGTVSMAKDKTLSGEILVGLTTPYLKWLPTAKSAIFTEEDGEFHVAHVRVSGTFSDPKQDLTPRVAKELVKSPGAAIKLFFHAL
jgi:hypothetical protein